MFFDSVIYIRKIQILVYVTELLHTSVFNIASMLLSKNMKGKNYEYIKEDGMTVLRLQSTDDLTKAVLAIDQQFLEGVLVGQQRSMDGQGWTGKCPFCSGISKSRKHSYASYRPAYLTPREMGYVFHCCSCKTNLTVFKFLLKVFGEERAQEYAESRWKAGELCGGGWNCPLPESVRQSLLSAKEKRREVYRREHEERRLLNRKKRCAS